LAASKASAAEEEERRKKEVALTGSTLDAGTGNGKENGHAEKGFLNRHSKGSKSMSRKSFGFLGGKIGNGEKPVGTGSTTSEDLSTAVEGEAGPQTPEKHVKSAKERFSFSGLGRKKSNLMSS